MTTEDALYAAILREPHDDTVRLAYADWLDENRQPERAEFVRVQVELQNAKPHPQGHVGRDESGRRVETKECPRSDCHYCRLVNAQKRLFHRDELIRLWFPEFDLVACSPVTQPQGTLGVVRRGFVDEVRLSQAAFVGGECGRCDGTGGWEGGPRCPACDGTGRDPGLAAAIFRAHPVTKVVLTDMEPYWNGVGYGWSTLVRPRWWFHPVPFASQLSDDLFNALTGGESKTTRGSILSGGRHRVYQTPQLALDALVATCVEYGRGKAAE